MAEARVSVNLDEFTCPICLDLLNDPVSIPCGHSFCMSCINTQWDTEEHRGAYSCPMCKHQFNPRPTLGRNVMLAEMVKKLRKTHVPERTLAGPEDVECDVCVGRKYKAVKSCLVCLASYCEIHFKLHNELNPGNTHKVTETGYGLKDRICSEHNKPKEAVCCTENKCVCCECLVDECRGHNTTTFRSYRFQQQGKVGNIQAQVLQRTQAAEKSMKNLKQAKKSIKSSAKTTPDRSEKIFAELIRSAEQRRSEIREIIKATEEAEVERAEETLQCMKREVLKLKKRENELVQLGHIDDDFDFVRECMTLFDFSPFGDAPHVIVNLSHFKEIQSSVSELEIKVKEFFQTGLHTKSTSVNRRHMVQTSVPILREDFLQYFCQLTADSSTAHTDLCLSEGDRKIQFGCTNQKPYRGLEIFGHCAQALSREALQERCYWEVEWGGEQVYIAASYKRMKQYQWASLGFGHDDISWGLRCNSSQFNFVHKSHETVIPGPVSTRIGVYLDHRGGSLSFYSITDTMTLLHRVRTTFTEPLHAGFWVFEDSRVKLCDRNEKVLPQTSPTVSNNILRGQQFKCNYFRQLPVDPRTAHNNLQLSEGNRKVQFDDTKPNSDCGPEVFKWYAPALCREALQERCYWEVEWGGEQVYIAASYRGVERKTCCTFVGFGHNDISWSLCSNSSQLTFFYKSHETVIPHPVSTRIGVYLDHRGGSLSFYSITDTMTLLHRVRTTFTEPLHAGFWVFKDSRVKLCDRNKKVLPQTSPTVSNNTSHGLQFEIERSNIYLGKAG
ncbi:tripartite motif-containing protein 16-like [Clarias gariepinus]